MKKKQWYVFEAVFFLIFVIFYFASSRPPMSDLQIESYLNLVALIDNRIEHAIATVAIIMSGACMISSRWADN
jgi:hypothetical protein